MFTESEWERCDKNIYINDFLVSNIFQLYRAGKRIYLMSKQKNQKRNLRRKDARPSEIIDSAMLLWTTQGFATTKIEDIAKGAGVAKGTVYLYFNSKEAIFETALKIRLASTMEEIIDLAMGDSLTTRELLQHFYDTVYNEYFIKESVTLMKVLIAEGHRFPDLVTIYRETALTKGIKAIKMILHRGVERGELSIKADQIDSRLVMAPVVMFATWSMMALDKQPKSEFLKLISDHTDLLINGLA